MPWRDEHRRRVLALEGAAARIMLGAVGDIVDGVAARLGATITAAADDPVPPGESVASVDELGAITSEWRAAVDRIVLPWFGGIFEAGGQAAEEQMAGIGVIVPAPDREFLDHAAAQHLAGARDRFFGLGDEAWDTARRELLAGFRDGEGIDELRRRVQRTTGLTRGRAEALARTEVIAASNMGANARVLSLGPDAPPYKQWLSTLDTRTRPTHVRADRQVVELQQPFVVGDAALQVPGDPGGPAGEVINCRCTTLYLDTPEPLDLDGRQEGGTEREPGIVDLVADPTLAHDPPSLATVVDRLGDRNRTVARALGSSEKVPVTRYGLSHGDGDSDADILNRARATATTDVGRATRRRVKLDGTLADQPTVNPHHVAKLVDDPEGVLAEGGYTAEDLPHVVDVDGRMVLRDGHHRAIADAATSEDGTFDAWVWDEGAGPPPFKAREFKTDAGGFSIKEAKGFINDGWEPWRVEANRYERQVVEDYTHDAVFSHVAINSHLRGVPGRGGRMVPKAKVAKKIENLDKAFAHPSAVAPDDIVVHRGITGEFAARLTEAHKNGQLLTDGGGARITDAGFMSTSLDPRQARVFAREGNKGEKVQMEIRVARGQSAISPGRLAGRYVDELEVLLPRGTVLEVAEAPTYRGGVLHLVMEVRDAI